MCKQFADYCEKIRCHIIPIVFRSEYNFLFRNRTTKNRRQRVPKPTLLPQRPCEIFYKSYTISIFYIYSSQCYVCIFFRSSIAQVVFLHCIVRDEHWALLTRFVEVYVLTGIIENVGNCGH